LTHAAREVRVGPAADAVARSLSGSKAA
jgi:hypothetical protein